MVRAREQRPERSDDNPDPLGPRHFALRVADCAEACAYFQSRGVAVEETTPIPGADRFFIRDPDGNRIEVIQWREPYDPARSGAAQPDGAGPAPSGGAGGPP